MKRILLSELMTDRDCLLLEGVTSDLSVLNYRVSSGMPPSGLPAVAKRLRRLARVLDRCYARHAHPKQEKP